VAPKVPPGPAKPAPPPDPTRRGLSDDECLADAREYLAGGKHDLARELLAKALRGSPRNRTLRALYHVAAGRRLMAHDDAVRAVAQLEAALAHDSDCAEAKASLAELQGDAPKKGGLFKRLFK
jgi:Tfp pilus assembly protein PilF